MVCNKCKNTGIYNEAGGKGFYYCRTCKIEIELEPVNYISRKDKTADDNSNLKLSQAEIDALFEEIDKGRY